MSRLYKALTPLLFRIPPETAHNLTMACFSRGLHPRYAHPADPALKVTLWGREFPSPVGMAAGFDKNAEAVSAVLKLGFGFTELGTVTPKPQDGNPQPRIFRAPGQGAVINRMGFPGQGMAAVKARLERGREHRKTPPGGLVGINIGINRDQENPAEDYRLLVRELGPLADYLAVNISSPNTPGLRDLQRPEHLPALLAAITQERDALETGPPLLLKLAPDLEDSHISALCAAIRASRIDGLILTNTTLSRPGGLPPAFAQETGGLSGRPLKSLTAAIIRRFYQELEGRLPIIGAGGIASGRDAYEHIRAGASLVQLYTGMIYEGPDIARKIHRELSALLKRDGYAHLSEAVGQDALTLPPAQRAQA